MNKAFLIGRLTRDPELRYSSSNAAIANFSIAIDRQYTNGQGQRETDFINIVAFQKQAENIKKYPEFQHFKKVLIKKMIYHIT